MSGEPFLVTLCFHCPSPRPLSTTGVFVGRTNVQKSNFANFSYDPPTIMHAKPTPIDAMGDTITFYGSNLADNWGVGAFLFFHLTSPH
jgi:hypothetical protein